MCLGPRNNPLNFGNDSDYIPDPDYVPDGRRKVAVSDRLSSYEKIKMPKLKRWYGMRYIKRQINYIKKDGSLSFNLLLFTKTRCLSPDGGVTSIQLEFLEHRSENHEFCLKKLVLPKRTSRAPEVT